MRLHEIQYLLLPARWTVNNLPPPYFFPLQYKTCWQADKTSPVFKVLFLPVWREGIQDGGGLQG